MCLALYLSLSSSSILLRLLAGSFGFFLSESHLSCSVSACKPLQFHASQVIGKSLSRLNEGCRFRASHFELSFLGSSRTSTIPEGVVGFSQYKSHIRWSHSWENILRSGQHRRSILSRKLSASLQMRGPEWINSQFFPCSSLSLSSPLNILPSSVHPIFLRFSRSPDL